MIFNGLEVIDIVLIFVSGVNFTRLFDSLTRARWKSAVWFAILFVACLIYGLNLDRRIDIKPAPAVKANR
jgi:hypothetical protein